MVKSQALLILVCLLRWRSDFRCNAFSVPHWDTGRSRNRLSALPGDNDKYDGLVQETQLDLGTGVKMQVLFIPRETGRQTKRSKDSSKPILLFLHGSFHGAWCWAEHYLEYFHALGYSVVAPSWRGTGGTFAGDQVKKVQIQQHVEDLQELLLRIPGLLGQAHAAVDSNIVVISHSFGGLAVMKYLERHFGEDSVSNSLEAVAFAGIANMCVVPPSGNGKMTMRYLRRSLRDSWKITKGFAMKGCLRDKDLCRELFFGGEPNWSPSTEEGSPVLVSGVTDEDLERYQAYFARDSEATIDLIDLGRQLPSEKTTRGGKALFMTEDSKNSLKTQTPCLVLGASRDFIVDSVGLEETARYYDVKNGVVTVDSPHDVMLGAQWKAAAQELESWLQAL